MRAYLYYDKRSEVTAAANELMHDNMLVPTRCRVMCACRYPHNFRDGILLIDSETDRVEYQLTRCRACRKEATDGNL